MKGNKIVVLLCLFVLMFSSCVQKGNNFPRKNIKVICPWAIGGGTDTILRAICATAEKELGVAIVVENIIGGGGSVGHRAIKDAKPDGYTLGMITFELNSLPYQKVIDFTYEDFDPLLCVNADSVALTVRSDAPYNTVGEFIHYAKKYPGKISIGNSSPGSVWHIGAGLLANETGIDVKHVAFEGAASAVTSLVSGHISAVSVSFPEVKHQVAAGNVKVLGIMSDVPLAEYPSIPTFKEQGFPLTYFTWRGLAFPKGVDPEIKKIVFEAFTKAMNNPEFIALANELNMNLFYLNSEDFGEFLKDNYNSVTKTLTETNLLK